MTTTRLKKLTQSKFSNSLIVYSKFMFNKIKLDVKVIYLII